MSFQLNDFEQYEAKFMDGNTGSIVKIIAKEEPDVNGLPRIQFYGYDESGNLLGSPCTLDQMMHDYGEHYLPMPKKSNNKYACVCTLVVQVPVDMREVDDRTYYEHMCSDNESEIAQEIACHRLKNLFMYNEMNVVEFEHTLTKEVK